MFRSHYNVVSEYRQFGAISAVMEELQTSSEGALASLDARSTLQAALLTDLGIDRKN